MIDVEREIRAAFLRHDGEAPGFDATDVGRVVRRTHVRQVANALAVAVAATIVILGAVVGIDAIRTGDPIPTDPSPAPPTGPSGATTPTGPPGGSGATGAKGLDIYAVDPVTGDAALVHDAITNVEDPERSPDGSTLLYARKGGGEGMQVFAVGPDGVERQLTTFEDGASAPTWSPDGAMIAFSAGTAKARAIYVMNADGTDPRVVADTPNGDVKPDWSPAADRIVFVSGTGGRDPSFGLWIVTLADGSLTQITDASDGDGDRSPAWSPLGDRIVFVRAEDAPGNNLEADDSDLWLVRPDGSGLHRVFEDERQLDPEAEGIETSSAAGTPDGHYQDDPEWSPDGRAIAWADVHAGVRVVDLGTQEVRNLTLTTWWDLSWDASGMLGVES